MFVDASAIVAIVALESDHRALAARLDGADGPFTSAVAIFEAVAAIVKKKGFSVPRAHELVRAFLDRTEVQVTSIDANASALALDAFDRYGKGRGHRAQLNMGDCFAYAMAKQHGVPLLHKGDDFSQTDLA